MMKKDAYQKLHIEIINKNFERRSKYFDFNFNNLNELRTLIFEINNCLISELYRASITLSNYLLERLLKLALIKNEIGKESRPIEKWEEIYRNPNNKFSSLKLGNSIEKCRKNNLITEDEKVILFDIIRDLIRNGFSHADANKILKNSSKDSKVHVSSFKNPEKFKNITIDLTIIPFAQESLISDFAKENAEKYFDFIFNLTNKINTRLDKYQP